MMTSIRFHLLIAMLCYMVVVPVLAQDATPTPIPLDDIPDFGKVLLSFDIPSDDPDFLVSKRIAVQPDMSRIYVASGVVGLVYIFDDKGRELGQVDVVYDYPIQDMAVGADGNLYITQTNNINIYDRDGQLIREILGRFFDQILYMRIALLDDKSIYAADFFSEKDRFYHLDNDGETITEYDVGFFSNLSGAKFSIWDEIVVGEDGFLYYFNDQTKTMFQIDAEGNLNNQYDGLIDNPSTDPIRSGILVDDAGQVWLGDFGEIIIFGAKEELIQTIKLGKEFDFVHDMAFTDTGLMVVAQPLTISIVQVG